MKFSITKNKTIFFAITLIMVVASIVSFIVKGFNLDIEFVGGTELTYNLGEKCKSEDEVQKLAEEVIGKEMVSNVKTADGGKTVIVRTLLEDEAKEGEESKVSEERAKVTEAIVKAYPKAEASGVNTVSAEVSDSLKQTALVATTIAILLMLVYIAFRFEVSSAFAAVVCLAHDVLIMLFAYSIFQIPFSSTVIAAILTILGYSINATIVIFDRVRENRRLMPGTTFEEKVDAGVRSTLWRSINTTITTLVTIGLIYFMGVTSIKNFALPLIVGIISGAYSSIFLSGNLWCFFKKLGKKR